MGSAWSREEVRKILQIYKSDPGYEKKKSHIFENAPTPVGIFTL